MKSIICIFSFLFICTNAFPQSVIQGAVQNENGSLVDFFTAAILSTRDSMMISGASCRDGILLIETKATGSVLLQLSSVGYKELTIPLNLVSEGRLLNIGQVIMNTQTISIDEVVVTFRRPTIVSKSDRTIVSVQGSMLSDAADGLEMLRKTPGLMHNSEGSITVFGKGVPIFFVDGRQVRSLNEIEALNPQNIKSIEVIDSPSAAYDAEGQAVVLIHTIKRDDHYFVRLGGALTQSRKTSGNGFGEVHWSKDKFSTDLYYGYTETNAKTFNGTSYYNNDTERISTDAHSLSNRRNHGYRFAMSYDISPKHTVGLQSSGYHIYSTLDREQSTMFTDVASQGFTTYSNINGKPWQLNGTLYYNFLIDSLGQSLRFVADATRIHNMSAQQYYNVLDGSSAGNPFINTNDNEGKNVLYSLKADYTKPLGRAWKIETGVKYYFIDSDNRTVQIGSTNSVQNYSSEEWNMAGYVSASTQLNEKMSLRYGLRGEYNHRSGDKNSVRYVDQSSFDLFPSVFFDYNVSENFSTGLAYAKRLERPSMSALDPSLIVDSLLTRMGNPDLKSTKSHIFQLSFGVFRDLNIRIGYAYKVDPYYFVVFRDEENPWIKNARYINRNSSKSYSLSITYSKDIFKWFTTSLYGGISQDEYKYTEDGIEKNNNKPVWALNLQNFFTLPWNFFMDVGFTYTSTGAEGSITNKSSWNLFSTLRRDFFNKTLSCRITVNDVFKGTLFRQQSVLPGKNITTFDGDMRYVRLSVAYKFGKSRYQYRSKSGSQDELDRMK